MSVVPSFLNKAMVTRIDSRQQQNHILDFTLYAIITMAIVAFGFGNQTVQEGLLFSCIEFR